MPVVPIKRLLLLAGALGLVLVQAILSVQDVSAGNWPRFRGPDGQGLDATPGMPRDWSPGDYAWSVDLPGVGHSSPIIWGDRLFVTSAVDEGAVRYLYCLDAHTGAEQWSRFVGMNRSHKHAKSSWASSTPTTNGELVFVAFADSEHLTLTAYTFAGALRWRRVLGRFTSQHGHGVSPIVYKDMVIIPNDQMGPSNVLALDAATGSTRWSALRDFRRTSYATPFVLEEPGLPPQLICVSGAMGISSLNPETGELNWMTGELPARTVASPVYADGLLVATCGGGGVGKLLISVAPDGSGDVSETHIRYRRERTLPYVPTPVAYQGHIYLWNDNGVVSCIKADTGENVWTKRVGGNFSGSPICVDGTLYCISEDGEVVMLAASPEYQLYGKVRLGDNSHATPAIADGRLYFRTFHKLFCLAGAPATQP